MVWHGVWEEMLVLMLLLYSLHHRHALTSTPLGQGELRCSNSIPWVPFTCTGLFSNIHILDAFRNSNRYQTSTPSAANVLDIARDVKELKLIMTNINIKGKASITHMPTRPTPILKGRGMSGWVRLKCRNAQNSIACPKQNNRFSISTTWLKESHPRHTTPDAESSTPYVGDPCWFLSPRNFGKIPLSAMPATCLQEVIE